MGTPTVLRWPMPGPVLGTRGRAVSCPECGLTDGLVLAMDLDDRSTEPSYVTCPRGHTWAESGVPRRVGAQLLDEILSIEPGLLASLAELQREHGDSL